MMELDFREPETFKTPDGTEYIVYPLQTRHIITIYRRYLRKNREVEEYNGNDEEELTKLEDEVASLLEQLFKASIHNKKSGKPELPKREYLSSNIESKLVKKIIEITTGSRGDSPLEMKEEKPSPRKKSSEKSKPTSSNSSKKQPSASKKS